MSARVIIQQGYMHRNVGGLSVNAATWKQKEKLQVLEAKNIHRGYSAYFLFSATHRPVVVLAPNHDNEEAIRQERMERAVFRNYTKAFYAPIQDIADFTGSYHKALFLASVWLNCHAPEADKEALGFKYIGDTEGMQMYYSNLRIQYLKKFEIQDAPGLAAHDVLQKMSYRY